MELSALFLLITVLPSLLCLSDFLASHVEKLKQDVISR